MKIKDNLTKIVDFILNPFAESYIISDRETPFLAFPYIITYG